MAKTNGNCAYCGCSLEDKRWHVDHVKPLQRGRDDTGGDDSEDNKMAACARCNLWKKTYSVDDFRAEISKQAERLLRDSAQFRLAVSFGVVEIKSQPVKFYFE